VLKDKIEIIRNTTIILIIKTRKLEDLKLDKNQNKFILLAYQWSYHRMTF